MSLFMSSQYFLLLRTQEQRSLHTRSLWEACQEPHGGKVQAEQTHDAVREDHLMSTLRGAPATWSGLTVWPCCSSRWGEFDLAALVITLKPCITKCYCDYNRLWHTNCASLPPHLSCFTKILGFGLFWMKLWSFQEVSLKCGTKVSNSKKKLQFFSLNLLSIPWDIP